MSENPSRPGRPLGLTLAFVLSLFLYSLVPLALLGMQLYIQSRIDLSASAPIVFEGQTYEALGAGGSSPLVTPSQVLVDGGGALLFMVVCAVVWRGGRSWMRGVFSATVLIFASITLYSTVRMLTIPASLDQGVSSGDTLVKSLLSGQLTAAILVPMYVLWYVNRAPARAFFRGYYAPESSNRNEA